MIYSIVWHGECKDEGSTNVRTRTKYLNEEIELLDELVDENVDNESLNDLVDQNIDNESLDEMMNDVEPNLVHIPEIF
jgi:hypothetical protein